MVKPQTNLPETDAGDDVAARHWLERIADHYPSEERERIQDAIDVMQRSVGGDMLETGESGARQRLATADILSALRMDAETLCAALLSGCIGRDGVDEKLISERFGASLARIVLDLGRIGQLATMESEASHKTRDRLRHEENQRRMLLGIAEDVRALLVVLAERLHLMRAAKHLAAERRRALALDTQRIYAPLANRLGVWQIKWELEDLSLRYLEPAEYQRIARLLRERRGERQSYIAGVVKILEDEFARIGLAASVSGRPKHIYSIWRKMQRKSVNIDGIFDLRAVRVMVDTEDDCYAALSVVHGLWPYIPEEFDDYISKPKGNLYRSLHTAVTGPEGKPLEVQIRTHEMHTHAEYGVAAHWAYKEASGHDASFQRRIVLMRNWLERSIEGAWSGSGDGDDAAEGGGPALDAASAPASSSIYVLTPQAKVIELPPGATPLDFAYAIHSEIGHRCRGARVDGRIVPLTHKLASGDTVEIITQKNASPSRDWLSQHHGYLATARARNRVRQWFKHQDYDRHLSDGRASLERELARLGTETRPQLEKVAARFNLQRGDDVLAAIGRGDLSAGVVARQLSEPRPERHDESAEEGLPPAPARRRRRPSGGRPEIMVAGVADLMTQIATCCRPVPHDDIIGFVTRGRGVVVHRRTCPNIRRLRDDQRDRLIDVEWAEQPDATAYPVDIVVVAADRKGLLRDVSSVLADEDTNVLSTNTQTDPTNDRASMSFTVEVADIDKLEQVMAKLRQLGDVIDVYRTQ